MRFEDVTCLSACTGSALQDPAFSSCGEWGLLSPSVRRLLTVLAPLAAERRLRHLGSGLCRTQARSSQWVALGCACFSIYGTWALLLHSIWSLPRQGFELNPCPLHWQADFYPLYHKASPAIVFYSNYRENTKLSVPWKNITEFHTWQISSWDK